MQLPIFIHFKYKS